MKNYLKVFLLFAFVFVCNSNLYSQSTKEKDSLVTANDQKMAKIEWEKPVNFFAAAGASYLFREHYNVTISPIDHHVQFERTYPIITRFSLGLVWNPIKGESSEDSSHKLKEKFLISKKLDPYYQLSRNYFAVALLINVFQLSYVSDFDISSPLDLGFGVGLRNKNFLILATLEFTPLRTPRQYFIDQFKDKNKQLFLAGANEPLRAIDIKDNSIFMNKLYMSVGIKIAYSFSIKDKGSD